MLYYLIFIIAGYFLGSILFAPIFGRIFGHKDVVSGTRDKNPGTANAFKEGGFFCGIMTLIFDMLKGFLPLYLCIKYNSCENALINEIGMGLVMLSPVLGHMFPVYTGGKGGGKGIATSFGVLWAFVPSLYPVATLAFWFLLFSLIIKINSDFYKTLIVYFVVTIAFLIKAPFPGMRLGFLLITFFVFIRFHLSGEEREKFEVKFIWKH